MARYSPILPVTKPRNSLPTVMPAQNPVEVADATSGLAERTLVMKIIIHPPSETSAPTYPNINRAKIQVSLFLSASLVRPDLALGPHGFSVWYTPPVCFQNANVEVMNSIAHPAICSTSEFLSFSHILHQKSLP